jgi:hypothetical protein
MREEIATLTLALSLAEGNSDPLAPGGGEGQSEGAAYDAQRTFMNDAG